MDIKLKIECFHMLSNLFLAFTVAAAGITAAQLFRCWRLL